MSDTTFAGLTTIEPGQGISDFNGKFLWRNPRVIDRLLRLGAVTHRHDAHLPLSAPGNPPVLTLDSSGGFIPSDTTIYVGFTCFDAYGGETKIGPIESITTGMGIGLAEAPTVAADNLGGVLLAGTYTYAVTITDGVGGESALGVAADATIDPGFSSGEVLVSGLSTVLGDAGGTTWRLWRSVNGSIWYLLTQGTGATYLDDGTNPGNCTVSPPTRDSTSGTFALNIAIPPQSSGTIGPYLYGIYVSDDPVFVSPCLYGLLAASSATVDVNLASLAGMLEGSPPPVGLSWPGANLINPDTDMLDFPWKRPVATLADLPLVDNADGDMRVVLATHELDVWDAGWSSGAGRWERLAQASGAVGGGGGGGGGGGSGAYTWSDCTYDSSLVMTGFGTRPIKQGVFDTVCQLSGRLDTIATVPAGTPFLTLAVPPVIGVDGYSPAITLQVYDSSTAAFVGNLLVVVTSTGDLVAPYEDIASGRLILLDPVHIDLTGP